MTPNSHHPLYLPTADLTALQQRAELLRQTRQFFHEHGYWEVETPVLSRETVIDLHLEPFSVQGDFGGSVGQATFYLQTSPEFAMKRLLAAGADRIFQITRAFRQAELGARHNPEFTILEWYALGEDHFQQMEFVTALCRELFQASGRSNALPPTFRQLTYEEAFQEVLGVSILELDVSELRQLAAEQGISVQGELSLLTIEEQKDDWLNLLLAERVEPWLETQSAVFLYHYPVSQAALAQACPADPRVAERFELYLYGVEICNGYHELTDAAELVRRNVRQNALRQACGLPRLPEESHLLTAMKTALPACSGVAVGLDRLLMLASGKTDISEVWAFPADRA